MLNKIAVLAGKVAPIAGKVKPYVMPIGMAIVGVFGEQKAAKNLANMEQRIADLEKLVKKD